MEEGNADTDISVDFKDIMTFESDQKSQKYMLCGDFIAGIESPSGLLTSPVSMDGLNEPIQREPLETSDCNENSTNKMKDFMTVLQDVMKNIMPSDIKMELPEQDGVICGNFDTNSLPASEHCTKQLSKPEKRVKKLTCCKKVFSSYSLLKEHRREKHTCPICDKDLKDVLRHMRDVHDKDTTLTLNRFSWACCSVHFEDFAVFTLHKRDIHRVDELKCSVCSDLAFPSLLDIESHYISAHCKSLTSRYKCLTCRYVFGVQSSFHDHTTACQPVVHQKKAGRPDVRQDESAVFQFVCCEQLFSEFVKFNLHKMAKHKIEQLVCGLCYHQERSTKALYRHYLKLHFRTHSVAIGNRKLKKKAPGQEITNLNDSPSRIPSTLDLADECSSDKESNSINGELMCTAQQEGILCRCSTCTKMVSSLVSCQDTDELDDTDFQKPHVCKICQIRFKYESRLKLHLQHHLGYKDFPCDICGNSFTKKISLTKHKLYKHSSNPLKMTCKTCSNVFVCKSSLLKHVRSVHLRQGTNLRVKCKYCAKTFAGPKSLNRHLNEQHLRGREFICHHCDRVYYDKGLLASHIKSTHLPPEISKCDMCEFVAPNKVTLRGHKRRNHSQRKYACEICGKTFPLKKTLEMHQVGHSDEKPYVCQTCGKGFKREANLQQHQYTHSEDRPHTCSVCGLSFRLRTHVKQHMSVHGLVKNHKCFICSKLFARKGELNVHLSDHAWNRELAAMRQ